MAKTYTFSVGASPAKTPITVQTWTNRIELQEDPSSGGYPSTDFLIYRPASTDAPVRFLAGSTFVIESDTGPMVTNQIVGYVAGVSGSATFAQIEQGLN